MIKDYYLSKNFKLSEFLKTSTGKRNVPTREQELNLINVVAPQLEQLRSAIGHKPIIITSGYRSPAVNRAAGGASNSAHLYGLAADFYCPYVSAYQLIMHAAASIDRFDQLILEQSIVHVGFSAKPRGQILLRTGSPRRWKYSPLVL